MQKKTEDDSDADLDLLLEQVSLPSENEIKPEEKKSKPPKLMKKRSAKTPIPKMSAFDAFDDTDSEVIANTKENSPKKSTENKIESSVISYLDSSLKDLSNSVIDEFNYLIENALSLESFTNKFMVDFNNQVKTIIQEEFQTQIIPDIVIQNTINSQINDQFEYLSRLIRSREKTIENPPPFYASDIDDSNDRINDNMITAIDQLTLATSPILNTSIQQESNLNDQLRKLQMHEVYLTEYGHQIDAQNDEIDKKVRQLEEKQSIYRQQQMRDLDNDIAFYGQNKSSNLRELINTLQSSNDLKLENSFKDIVNDISKGSQDISMTVDQTIYRTESLCRTVSKYRKMQWDQLQIADEATREADTSQLTGSMIGSEITEQSNIVSKVRAKLRSIQMNRAEDQFEV
ncbi:hypothetical protein TVAG_261270 [Trichomonas vaginalis G3]|uniref:Uncharacterized protein n=1 Tax=Trichomonas vaginalis (strain ATCC PRA-98 / G3) TaxID=412133 RepID=A2G188_TRIV3|nr:hypothetical protein TVAGG3_0559380 [Trichomonas vaginalis G3]EAX89082.1 hypothetical protein TVAG_261270 [Trichomonas vaginalis G3]KAI5521077.1 hypothetical protein TVAGG3_0559380 [Trichomonas vaginalis G3]|eukprot:XP_001302012.1 hypothetical protein [Trichomonas vaginalis G3]